MTVQVLDIEQYLEDLSSLPIKAWLIGPPGSAKTGSLEALVRMGLRVHLLSIDGNIRPLADQIRTKCPSKKNNLDVVRISQEVTMDLLRSTPTGSHAIDEIERAIFTWPKGDVDTSTWTPKEDVLVIDNLTNISNAAVMQVRRLNSKLGGKPMDFGMWGVAHDRILSFYENLASSRWNCNVLCICHLDYTEVQTPTSEGVSMTSLRGFPATIGKSLGGKISGTFETAILYESRHDGRFISTSPTRGVDVKIPIPDDLLNKELPASEGLGMIFAALRGQPYQTLEERRQSDQAYRNLVVGKK